MPQLKQPVVFISYSHKDEREKDKLVSHLGVLRGAGLIDVWSDDRIAGGADREQEIEQAIAQANVAILLVSANFLNSDFILDKEVPTFLKRRKNEGMTVFPVIAKACAWKTVDWLAEMEVRPTNNRPVWGDIKSDVDTNLAAIAEEVAEIVKKINLTSDPGISSGDTTSQRIPFTNREDEIRLVLSSFAPAYYLLDAPAGYGKTELLQELEQRFQEQDWRCVYVSIDEQDTLSDLAITLAKKLSVTLILAPELSWGSRLGGALNRQWENDSKQGLVLLMDFDKKPALLILKELLEEFIPDIYASLNILTYFFSRHNRFRVILAGRYLAASKEMRANSLQFKHLHLTPFDYDVIRDTAGKYLSSQNANVISQLAAHLVYLSGGHPGCIAQILEMYKERRVAPDRFLEACGEMIWENIVQKVVNDIRDSIPQGTNTKELYKVLDRLSIFRYLDFTILRNMIGEFDILEMNNEYDLADELTATYLLHRKGRFLRDDIIRRLLAIGLQNEKSEEFPIYCQQARDICAMRLQESYTQRPEIWIIEYLFLSLQQHACLIQDHNQRTAIRGVFFEDVSNALQMFIESTPAKNRQEDRYALNQAMEDDWEFRFTVNYYLRQEEVYSDEPFKELHRQIDRFFDEQSGITGGQNA